MPTAYDDWPEEGHRQETVGLRHEHFTELIPIHPQFQSSILQRLETEKTRLAKPPVNASRIRHELINSTISEEDMFKEAMQTRKRLVEATIEKRERTRVAAKGVFAPPELTVGICLDMCPLWDRLKRANNKSAISTYEVDDDLVFGPNGAVKSWHRPAAGEMEDLPVDLRTEDTLIRTLDYLIHDIIDKWAFYACQNFVWDRTRSIRQDCSIQGLKSDAVIECYERIARFHIFSIQQMSHIESFQRGQELEQLSKTLISLNEMYEDRARYIKQGKRMYNVETDCEAEFRAYTLMSNLYSPQQVARAMQLPARIRNTLIFRTALRLFKYAQRANHDDKNLFGNTALSDATLNWSTMFFDVVKDKSTPYLLGCLAAMEYNNVKKGILKTLEKSFPPSKKSTDLQRLADLVNVADGEEVKWVAEKYGLKTGKEGDKQYLICPRRNQPSTWIANPSPPPLPTFSLEVETKRGQTSQGTLIPAKLFIDEPGCYRRVINQLVGSEVDMRYHDPIVLESRVDGPSSVTNFATCWELPSLFVNDGSLRSDVGNDASIPLFDLIANSQPNRVHKGMAENLKLYFLQRQPKKKLSKADLPPKQNASLGRDLRRAQQLQFPNAIGGTSNVQTPVQRFAAFQAGSKSAPPLPSLPTPTRQGISEEVDRQTFGAQAFDTPSISQAPANTVNAAAFQIKHPVAPAFGQPAPAFGARAFGAAQTQSAGGTPPAFGSKSGTGNFGSVPAFGARVGTAPAFGTTPTAAFSTVSQTGGTTAPAFGAQLINGQSNGQSSSAFPTANAVKPNTPVNSATFPAANVFLQPSKQPSLFPTDETSTSSASVIADTITPITPVLAQSGPRAEQPTFNNEPSSKTAAQSVFPQPTKSIFDTTPPPHASLQPVSFQNLGFASTAASTSLTAAYENILKTPAVAVSQFQPTSQTSKSIFDIQPSSAKPNFTGQPLSAIPPSFAQIYQPSFVKPSLGLPRAADVTQESGTYTPEQVGSKIDSQAVVVPSSTFTSESNILLHKSAEKDFSEISQAASEIDSEPEPQPSPVTYSGLPIEPDVPVVSIAVQEPPRAVIQEVPKEYFRHLDPNKKPMELWSPVRYTAPKNLLGPALWEEAARRREMKKIVWYKLTLDDCEKDGLPALLQREEPSSWHIQFVCADLGLQSKDWFMNKFSGLTNRNVNEVDVAMPVISTHRPGETGRIGGIIFGCTPAGPDVKEIKRALRKDMTILHKAIKRAQINKPVGKLDVLVLVYQAIGRTRKAQLENVRKGLELEQLGEDVTVDIMVIEEPRDMEKLHKRVSKFASNQKDSTSSSTPSLSKKRSLDDMEKLEKQTAQMLTIMPTKRGSPIKRVRTAEPYIYGLPAYTAPLQPEPQQPPRPERKTAAAKRDCKTARQELKKDLSSVAARFDAWALPDLSNEFTAAEMKMLESAI